ncbi:MAG: 1-aminocyclopropane-1-carboxylate deaminase [Pseudomonadales bacterium]|nr:1-aminocyclopropane-1-carboxylate deaminase [Pseudomonadales bacterium]RLU02691.1 MAG: pyridoxal-phosphate dependent enzyme [Ketobacter sp.]
MSSLPAIDSIPALERELSAYSTLDDAGLLAPIEVQGVEFPPFAEHQVNVDVLRADQLHSVISGNKWFKLKYNFLQARHLNCDELLSFGGAWSNHLHALAFVGQMLGMRTHGIVRGDELTIDSSPMLREAHQYGMELEFVSRRQFRNYRGQYDDLLQDKRYVIPEGGDNDLGMLGAASLLFQTKAKLEDYSHVLVAVGTGCTFAGLRLALPDHITLIGVSALKGAWVKQAMAERLSRFGEQNWMLDLDHHCGGFARTDQRLLSFVANFGDNTGLYLEPVYTGKVMLALQDLAGSDVVPPGSRVLFIHSGGLQGARGFGAN